MLSYFKANPPVSSNCSAMCAGVVYIQAKLLLTMLVHVGSTSLLKDYVSFFSVFLSLKCE